MKQITRWPQWLVCIFFLLPSFTWGALEQEFPAETALFLSIKDFPHLEDRLFQAGLLALPVESRAYLADYLAQKHGMFKLYKTFRNLEPQHPLKMLFADVAVVELADQTTLLFLTVNPQYAALPNMLEKLQSVEYVQKFLSNALGQRYFAWIVNQTVVVSRSETAWENFQAAPKIQPDAGLLSQVVATDGDVVMYSRKPELLHPFLAKVLFGEQGSREFAVSATFATKSATIYTPPAAAEIGSAGFQPAAASMDAGDPKRRTLDFGWYIPEQAIVFLDNAENPGDFLQRFFGGEMLNDYLLDFHEGFTDQCSLALLDINEELTPSFVWVTQAKGGRHAQAAPTLLRFLADVVGEDFAALADEDLELPSKWGSETSGMRYYTLSGFHVITDSYDQVADALRILTGRSPSIWDKQVLASIDGLLEKPTVLFVDFEKLAGRLAGATAWDEILDPTYFKKDDVAAYLDALKKWGRLLGYGECTPQFNRYFLELK